AAKVVIDGLDQGNHHPVLVRGAEVTRVAVRRAALVRVRVGNSGRYFADVLRAFPVDQPAPLVGVCLRDQTTTSMPASACSRTASITDSVRHDSNSALS